MSALIIGVAGPSSTGKTTFCLRLADALPEFFTSIIALDGFRKPDTGDMVSPASGCAYKDFSNPEYMDFPLVIEQVNANMDKDIVLIEGLFTFFHLPLYSMLDLKLYFDAPAEERLYRRILRNTSRNDGSTAKSVGEYHLHSASLREWQYVYPTKSKADIIMDGATLSEAGMAVFCKYVRDTRLRSGFV